MKTRLLLLPALAAALLAVTARAGNAVPPAATLLSLNDPGADRRLALLIGTLTIVAFWRYCRRQMKDSAPKDT